MLRNGLSIRFVWQLKEVKWPPIYAVLQLFFMTYFFITASRRLGTDMSLPSTLAHATTTGSRLRCLGDQKIGRDWLSKYLEYQE